MVIVRYEGLKEKDEFRKITLARSTIIFFDVFIAFMIITGSSVLLKTDFGKVALIFGFFMLILTSILRILRRW